MSLQFGYSRFIIDIEYVLFRFSIVKNAKKQTIKLVESADI